jgi:hypothetical protein
MKQKNRKKIINETLLLFLGGFVGAVFGITLEDTYKDWTNPVSWLTFTLISLFLLLLSYIMLNKYYVK